jgi:BioD-like phosphotransacetylase family protein
MSILYITSTTEKAGKTMYCAGLGKTWADKGKKVGYLKPLIKDSNTQAQEGDKDILFMQQLLNLKDSIEVIGPAMRGNNEANEMVKQSCAAVAREKDMVIIEGISLDRSAALIEELDAKVLVIQDYSTSLSQSLDSCKKLGPRLMGVVVNKVPKSKVTNIQNQYLKELSSAGISLLGVIPEDRVLMSMSVTDLADSVQGKILNNADKAGEIIENFMMGSSTFDRGPVYYSRKENKAVVLWGERPGVRKAALSNLQLAAIQTSSKCILISGSAAPIPAVVQKAEERQIPLISAPGDLTGLITKIERSMSTLKFNQEKKIPRLLEILGLNLNSNLLMGV